MTAAVVGALACQKDTFLRKFTTTVVSCSAAKPGGFDVEFQDTILFPEGGGQPTDYGVLRVPNDKDTAIHVNGVRRNKLQALHRVDQELPVGTEVEMEVDWARRWDHAQQHTGQHLLSAVLDKRHLYTKGWGLGEKVCYIELERKLTAEEQGDVEKEVNDLIVSRLPVWVEVPEKDKVVKDKLPEDYDHDQGVLRVIHIGDLDANPCCGTHLSSTHQLRGVALLHSVPAHGMTRLFFNFGDRLISSSKDYNNLTKTLGAKLSCQTEAIVDKVNHLSLNLRETGRREKAWMTLVAKSEAARIKSQLQEDGSKVILVHMPDPPTLDYLNLVLIELGIKDFSTLGNGIVLASGQAGTPGAVIILGPRCDEIAAKLKGTLQTDIKGGGKKGKWQGKVTKWSKAGIDTLESL